VAVNSTQHVLYKMCQGSLLCKADAAGWRPDISTSTEQYQMLFSPRRPALDGWKRAERPPAGVVK